MHVYLRIVRARALQCIDGRVVLLLYSEHAVLRACRVQSRAHAVNDLFGVHLHQVLIGTDQRFALGAVRDHILRGAVQFYMRREAGASRADHSRGLYEIEYLLFRACH